ncbi:MAG TPA: poly-beta-1,6-N-acetyl-D-glucosamine N-deacetylase PgaB [Gammaproteobacteria bacterium]|nr:poly-beta-1,6-N-acetyl-D-glucosamine N-deacetylase PgaB [Gammaproteobacteria bacterium]
MMLLLLAFWVGPGGPAAASTPPALRLPKGDFVTLAFHDVRDGVRPARDRDPFAISTRRLAQIFDWLHAHGWHPVSVQQIVAAHDGGNALPPNAVLLSFDDGLESAYTRVYPLLRAFDYPALFALETGWLRRVHGGATVVYHGEVLDSPGNTGGRQVPRSANRREPGEVFYNGAERGAAGFLSWKQVREMASSGLVEFATHTDHLHHGIRANPQGNLEPAAITRRYDASTGSYETDAEFRRRIRDDLRRSIESIRRHTGRRPRVVVWPYGAMNREVIGIARSLGLTLSFGLGDSRVSSPSRLDQLGRFLVSDGAGPSDIMRRIDRAVAPRPRVQRAIQVDLDDVYDPDPAQANRNLGKLLDRIKAMHVRTVYLQAFADPDGDGTASALYFPNRYLPVRADLFNRVAWQLKTRAGVEVYAWLPLLAFDLPDKALQRRLAVTVPDHGGGAVPSAHAYRRLSPFLPRSQRIAQGIYAELARNASFVDGVLIGDDAYLAGDEDASACRADARWPGTGRSLPDCHLDARQKTRALIAFGRAAVAPMRDYVDLSNGFRVARNLYARVVMDPAAEDRFAQALGPFLKSYDEVALMAMPYLDGTSVPPARWLQRLRARVATHPDGLRKVVFELQARDWRSGKWIGGIRLRRWMDELVRGGAVNLAYYPDDFAGNRPAFAPTFAGISLNDFPHRGGDR